METPKKLSSIQASTALKELLKGKGKKGDSYEEIILRMAGKNPRTFGKV